MFSGVHIGTATPRNQGFGLVLGLQGKNLL
jgi:hypothetical protein